METFFSFRKNLFIKDSLFRCIVLDIKNDFILSDI